MIDDLNKALDYIEDNLTNDLSIENIAKHVGISDYHFRKIFQAISGLPLSEYIKKRKLSLANVDLKNGESVTKVAFKYGYHSVDGFSRAFKNWTGSLPSNAMHLACIKSFPKLTFTISIRGGIDMEYRLENKPAIKFVGVSTKIPMQFEGVNQSIVELANSISNEQKSYMHALNNIEPKEVLNISYDADAYFEKEEGYLTHMIGVITDKVEINRELLDVFEVEAHTWAVFPNEGHFPSTMQNTMASIYAEWLPSSGYELEDVPNFSFTKMNSQEETAYSEIWIAVRSIEKV